MKENRREEGLLVRAEPRMGRGDLPQVDVVRVENGALS